MRRLQWMAPREGGYTGGTETPPPPPPRGTGGVNERNMIKCKREWTERTGA